MPQNTKTPSTIKQGFKQFEEKFGEKMIGNIPYKDHIWERDKHIKSHFKQMFLSLANERIESLRGRIVPRKGNLENDLDFIEQITIHNSALSEEVNYWENFINQLNEIR